MSYDNSLQNTSIDLINGKGPETPPGRPYSVDGPWLPPLFDSSDEEDSHWQRFFEGTPPPTPSESDKTEDETEQEEESEVDLEEEAEDDDREEAEDDGGEEAEDDDEEVSSRPPPKKRARVKN